MNAPNPLKSACDRAGYDFNKLPKGATDVKKNDDGTYTITVNGQPQKYNKDGSVFSQPTDNTPATPSAGDTSGNKPTNNGNGDNGGSVFNQGGGGNGGGMTITNVGAGYDIDPNLFMGSAMGFDSSTQMASNMPFGLGAVFGQGNVARSLQSFLNSVSFNFDFSQINIQRQQQQAIDEARQATATGGTPSAGDGPAVRGDAEVETDSGDKTTIDNLAKEKGYEKTNVSGVYKKGDKYYKYDADKKAFVECNSNGSEITEAQRKAEAQSKKKSKAQEEAAALSEDLFDAMKGAGTKNQKLADTVGKITKDNVIEVFEAWETNFSDSMDGENLIESIQNEHYTGWFGNQQEKEENMIVEALYKRAMELGLKNEAAACRAKVNAEHNAWFTSDSTVKTAIITLVNQIKAKEAGVPYATLQQQQQ